MPMRISSSHLHCLEGFSSLYRQTTWTARPLISMSLVSVLLPTQHIKTDFPILNHSRTKHALPDTFAVVKPAYHAKDDPTIPKLGDKDDLQHRTTSLLAAAQTKEHIWLETCEKTIFKGTHPASGEVSSLTFAITYDYIYRFCLKAT